MSCPRCDNLMVEETFIDWESDVHPLGFRGWRCVICGAIVDPLIVLHQERRPEPLSHQARTKKVMLWGHLNFPARQQHDRDRSLVPQRGSVMRLASSIRRGSSEEDKLAVMESEPAKRRVLVVDDGYDHRLILCQRLAAMGFDVVGEENGASALARIALEIDRMPLSGVLLEVCMSLEDGMAVLRSMRERYPQIPVIAMSDSLNVALLREAVRRGASEYVVKPFDPELLRRKCLRAFGGGEPAAEKSLRHG